MSCERTNFGHIHAERITVIRSLSTILHEDVSLDVPKSRHLPKHWQIEVHASVANLQGSAILDRGQKVEDKFICVSMIMSCS